MLTKKTKYALRALIVLVKAKDQKPMLISQIAATGNLPKRFLEGILLEMKRKQLLGSKMGLGGGYYLLQPPSEIMVSSVVRILEGPIALLPCVSINFYQRCEECQNERTCSIREMMEKVREATLKIMGNTSIEDLALREKELSL